ncbi:MAG: hypothetical protein H7X93_08520 [Sphingomonadaceae bacterium]|nr:hypothetical protein [Sphingomonadaceae bacterium]
MSGKKVARKKPASARPTRARSGSELGTALRGIYDEAVSEQIPAEMLDLLGKLR